MTPDIPSEEVERVAADDGWNPRPDPEGTAWNTKAYMCGYTDGFYDEPFGSHDRGQYGAFSAYRIGFDHARRDRAPELFKATVALKLIEEKASFHRDRAEPDSNLALGLGEIADIATRHCLALRTYLERTAK